MAAVRPPSQWQRLERPAHDELLEVLGERGGEGRGVDEDADLDENPCRLGEFVLDGPESPVFGSRVTLRWRALAAASSYDVFFGPSEDPEMLGNQTETSRTIDLSASGLYFWKVATHTSCGSMPATSGV